jgi:hypothetical protein
LEAIHHNSGRFADSIECLWGSRPEFFEQTISFFERSPVKKEMIV